LKPTPVLPKNMVLNWMRRLHLVVDGAIDKQAGFGYYYIVNFDSALRRLFIFKSYKLRLMLLYVCSY
jgi:hypothetical protein